MPLNRNGGPDLEDDIKLVEVKFGLSPTNWTLHGKQVYYKQKDKPIFLLAGLYVSRKEIKDIKTKNLNILESYIISRESFLFSWEWVEQFPIRKMASNDYKYIDFNKRPSITASYEVEKGRVHITEGVPVDLFKIAPRIQRGAIPCNALPA